MSNNLFRLPQQYWEIPTEEGSSFTVEGATPKEPTNLIVRRFKISQLAKPVQKVIPSRLNAQFVDLFQLPKELVLDDTLVIPSTPDMSCVGIYGYETLLQTEVTGGSSLLLRREDVKRSYIFYAAEDSEPDQGFVFRIMALVD